MKDRLEQLFEAQAELMEKMGIPVVPIPNFSHMSLAEFPWLAEGAMGIASEAGEVLDALVAARQNKPWKANRADEEYQAEFIEEVVDVLFFVLEVCILVGLEPSGLMATYRDKTRKLHKRIEEAQNAKS